MIHIYRVNSPHNYGDYEYGEDSFYRISQMASFYHHVFSEVHSHFTSSDDLYYIRGENDDPDHGFDKTSSNFDELTGQLFARQRYASFAREKLKACMQKS